MGKIEIRATTDGRGGITFVGSVCESSEGESSSRMRAEMIWRLVELWRDDIERNDPCRADNERPRNEIREEV